MADNFVKKLMAMNVPELENELQRGNHTVIDQYIINEILTKKKRSELLCQADKNFVVKQRSYRDSCIQGVSSLKVIRDNDNQALFDISGFQSGKCQNVKVNGNEFLIRRAGQNYIMRI